MENLPEIIENHADIVDGVAGALANVRPNKGTYHESQKASIYNYRNNNRQKYNEYQKQLYEKQMADPEFRKAHNEKKRIYQALRREQKKNVAT